MNIATRLAGTGRKLILRGRLWNRDFSVISNNCWGGHIYNLLAVP